MSKNLVAAIVRMIYAVAEERCVRDSFLHEMAPAEGCVRHGDAVFCSELADSGDI